MKHIKLALICLCMLIVFPSCGILNTVSGLTETAKSPQQVAEAIGKLELNILVNWIYPTGQQPRYIASGYTMKIKNSKVNTRLPFIGNTYGPTSFGEDPAIIFKDLPIFISQNVKGQKGEYLISYTTRVNNEIFIVDLTIWEDGKVNIVCKGDKRSTMSYSGELRFSK